MATQPEEFTPIEPIAGADAPKEVDYNALLKQFGGSAVDVAPTAPKTPEIDYGALLKQHGGTAVDAAPSSGKVNNIDFGRLLKQFGGTAADAAPAAAATVRGMEQLGGVPPGPPARAVSMQYSRLAPIPKADTAIDVALRAPGEALAGVGVGGPFLQNTLEGIGKVATGVHKLVLPGVARTMMRDGKAPGLNWDQILKPPAAPNVNQTLSGASDVMEGVVKAGEPLAVTGALVNPAATALTVGIASAANAAASKGATALGAPPEVARFAGNVASIAALGIGGDRILSKMDAVLEKHNVSAETLLETERAKGELKDRIDQVFQGESYPIVVKGVPARLEYAGSTSWRVVAENGKVLTAGKGRDVTEWLQSRGVRPLTDVNLEAPRPVQSSTAGPPEATSPITSPIGENQPITKGSTYPSEQGSLTVSSVRAGKVYFGVEGKSGRQVLPLADFQALVKPKVLDGEKPQVLPEKPVEQNAPESGAPIAPSPVSAEPVVQPVPPSESAVAPGSGEGQPQEKADEVTPESLLEQAPPAGKPEPTRTNPNQPEPTRTETNSSELETKPAATESSAAPTETTAPAGETPKVYDYSSTQLNMPPAIAEGVRAFAGTIPKGELSGKSGEGEETPHVTLKYGNPQTDPAPIQEVLKGEGPITVTLGKASLFHTDAGDVLKVEVDSPELHRLNAKVGKAVEHTGNTFPEYKPHVTIAYLKKGEGEKYDGKDIPGVSGQQVTLDNVTFSGKDGKLTEIPLTGASSAPQGGAPATPVSGEKQKPWRMTQAEWFDHKWSQIPKKARESITAGDEGFVGVDGIRQQSDGEHRRNIEQAVRDGKPVPPEVLADYPDLKSAEGASSAPQSGEPATPVSQPVAEEPQSASETPQNTQNPPVPETVPPTVPESTAGGLTSPPAVQQPESGTPSTPSPVALDQAKALVSTWSPRLKAYGLQFIDYWSGKSEVEPKDNKIAPPVAKAFQEQIKKILGPRVGEKPVSQTTPPAEVPNAPGSSQAPLVPSPEQLEKVKKYAASLRGTRPDGPRRAAARHAQAYAEYLQGKIAEPPEVQGDYSHPEIEAEVRRILTTPLKPKRGAATTPPTSTEPSTPSPVIKVGYHVQWKMANGQLGAGTVREIRPHVEGGKPRNLLSIEYDPEYGYTAHGPFDAQRAYVNEDELVSKRGASTTPTVETPATPVSQERRRFQPGDRVMITENKSPKPLAATVLSKTRLNGELLYKVQLDEGGIRQVFADSITAAGASTTPTVETPATPVSQREEEKPTPTGNQTFKVVMKGSGQWISSGQRWATEGEAQKAGSELHSRWMGMGEWKVEPSTEPVNYRWDNENYKGVSVSPEEGQRLMEEASRTKEEAEAEAKRPPAIRLADAVYDKLKAGQSLGNQPEFYQMAEKLFGSPRTSGTWDVKDAMDAMEGGVNRWIIENGARLLAMDPIAAIKELRRLMTLLPTQGTRTDEQLKAQQFSTPPHESFVAAKAAGLRPDDVVMEPSGGNGGIAAYPKSLGATVYVNEISDRRLAMLKYLGFENATAHDGELINALLDPSIKPSVVLMNPPFSSGALKSHLGKNRNQYGFNHVDQALQRLANGGRLVAILGGGRADDLNGGASFTGGETGKWFDRVRKLYNIRANVRINGKEYQKYGTTFATRIIVIDKSGPTPGANWDIARLGRSGEIVQGHVDTLEEAYNLLRKVADDRPQVQAGNGSQTSAGQGQPGTGVGASPRPGGIRGGGTVRGGPGSRGTRGPANRPAQPAGSPGVVQPGAGDQPAGIQQPGPGSAGSPEATGTPSVQGGPQSDELRPVSGDREPGSGVTTLGGFSAQDIIDAATKALSSKQDTAPAAASPVAPKPRTPRAPKAAASTPTPPAPPEKPSISSAAQSARDRLRQRLTGDKPQFERENVPDKAQEEFKQNIVDLATIGAEHLIAGSKAFDVWSEKIKADVGDLIDIVAKQAKMSPAEVLRQVHQLAQAVAVNFQPLDGNETKDGGLTLEQALRSVAERIDTDAYVAYNPTIKGGAHPGDIVETKTMATVPLPEITYKPHLPPAIMEKGLSAVQMEAVAIAGQQNEIILPGGARAAALIGDGTGVGKGRIAAGYLWDQWRQGRKRLVFVTEKWDLMQDIIRDLNGIGANAEMLRGVDKLPSGKYAVSSKSQIRPLNQWNYGKKIEHNGIVFSTYGTVRAKNKQGSRKVAQLIEYLKGADDGEGAAIVMDESHALKNAVPARGMVASQTGAAVKLLLDSIPKLRSLSLSATAATDVVNLGYLDRLGLWGPGTPFPNGFSEFQQQIASGGLSAMEMIARELKAQGKYVSRTLSYHGVEYTEAEHKLTPEQKELYRTAVKAWGIVLDNASSTIANTTNGGSTAQGNFLSQFYGAQQRFFNLLITTLKIPTCVEAANEALAAGKSVVISLVNTNEAAQNREKNKATDEDDDDELPDYDFGPGELLKTLVQNHYPTQQWADDVNDNGDPIKVAVYTTDAQGREIPQTNPTAEAARDELIAQIDRDLHMPDNPLDILIQSLGGSSKVAELTGRKEKYDRNLGKFVSRGDPGTPQKDINLVEMRNFQAGKKRVAVLSGAAGTGISLHAGNDVGNQQQRVHITLQVGWSADKAMQMFGRTHRTNQKQPPQYVMLVSDLGGEKRFVSTISRRLGSLGALTKGQKNATGGTDLMEKVNFETDQGRAATNTFYEQMLRNGPIPGAFATVPSAPPEGEVATGKEPEVQQQMTGMQILHDLHVLKPQGNQGVTVPPAERTNVTRLLNRLLALDPDLQNAVYNYFYDIFQATVQAAIDRGQLDTGVKTLPGDEFNIKEQRVISKDPATGAETFYYPVDVATKTKRVSPADLNKRLAQHGDENPSFLVNDKGKVQLLWDAPPLVHETGRVESAFYRIRPDMGKPTKITRTNIPRNTREVNEHAAAESTKATNDVEAAERRVEYSKSTAERNPSSSWAQENVTRDEKALEAARAALAEAEKVAKDPAGWAKSQWADQYEEAKGHITDEHHFIGGAVLRFWNPIKDITGRPNIYTAVDSKTGKRIVGIEVPKESIGQLLQRITGGASTVNASQLVADVLRNNLTYTLEGGIQVRPGRIGRDPVIQLIPPNPSVGQTLRNLGVLYEKGVQPVYYLPNIQTGPPRDRREAVAERVIQQYPIQQATPSSPNFERTPPGASNTPGKSVNASTVSQEKPDFERTPSTQSKGEGVDAGATGEGHDFALLQRGNRILSNKAGLQALADSWDEHDIAAMKLGPKHILRAVSHLRETAPEVARALESAGRGGRSVIIANGNRSLTEVKKSLRHEGFHATQDEWANHLGEYTQDFLDHALAQKAVRYLESYGYNDRDMPFEIAAHLAGGQWERIGLNRDQARELFGHYLDLISKQHGPEALAAIGNIEPVLRRVLDAKQADEKGQVAEAAEGAPAEPGGVPESVQRGIPGAGGQAGDVARGGSDAGLGEAGAGQPQFARAPTNYSKLVEDVKSAPDDQLPSVLPLWLKALKSAERLKLVEPGALELANELVDSKSWPVLRQMLEGEFTAASESTSQPQEKTDEGGAVPPKAAAPAGGGGSGTPKPPPSAPVSPTPGGKANPLQMSSSKADLYKAGQAIKAAADSLLKLFAPAARQGAHEAAMSVRFRAAQLARETAQAEAALEAASKALKRLPVEERWAFYDRAETGEPEPDRALFDIGQLFRKMLDSAREDVQELGTGKLENFIENYLPHIYKEPEKAQEAFATYYAKAPLEGKKSFLKRRKFETLKDAMDIGLEPVTDNPVDLVLLKLREMQKYVMAHRVLNDLKEQGIVQYIKSGDRLPANFEPINDKVATVYGPRTGAVGLPEGANVEPEDVRVYGARIMGSYAAPEPAARIVNNYLSPGLRGNILYRGYLTWANSMNQFQLGFSAFHLGFTSMDAAVSKFALGVYQASHGHPIKGLASAVQFPVAAFTGIVKGDRMLKEYYKPGSQGEHMGTLVDAMLLGGGRAKMDSFYQTQITKKMRDSVWQMSPLRRALGGVAGGAAGAMIGGPAGAAAGASLGLAGALRLPFAIAEQVTRPIMEWVVPRQKMAVFADLAQFELERLKEGRITEEDLQAALARAWDSVDNRMGQLVYDNLFWNKIFKDLLMGSVRSVGWNTGTIREIMGGLGDVRKLAAAGSPPAGGGRGKWSPDVSTRLSYIIALPIVAGLIGALVNYLYTGDAPKDGLDYLAPRTGRTVKGRQERIWLPSYMKDIIGVAEQGPYKVARGKLHPLLTMVAEMLGNEDYWHKPIVKWDDPAAKVMKQIADEVLKAYTPMAVRSAEQEKERGSSLMERIPPFFGVTPAPAYLNQAGKKVGKSPFAAAGNAFNSSYGKW